jgi:PIN domain nuclease of toxin-antitoxin system
VNVLLDTHVWLWALLSPERLSERAVDALENPENSLLFSAASSWEISIKYALKKLKLPEPHARYIPTRLERLGVTPMSVEHVHALRVSELPHHHRDPFDRLLIAQAQLEEATVATADPQFLLYDIDVLWAAAGEPPSAVHESGRRLSVNGLSYLGSRRRRGAGSRSAKKGTVRRSSRAPRGRKPK